MNLTALQARCAERFRDPNQDIITNAQWLNYLNDAYADVQSTTDAWPWMETASTSLSITANTRSVSLPTNVFRVISVLNTTDDVRLIPLDGTDLASDLFPEQTEAGAPSLYRVFGTTLEVYPLPTATTALKVEYYGPAADLASGSDVPAFPTQWHRILVEGALMRAYLDDANPPQSQVHETQFAALLESMRLALLDTRQSRYHEIVDNWYD